MPKSLLIVSLLTFGVLPLSAQVQLKLTPEPMAVPTAQLANAKDLGRWQVSGCNTGSTPVTLAQEQIDLAIPPNGPRLIDAGDAALVLNSHAGKGFWNQVGKWSKIAGPVLAFALLKVNVVNASAAVGIGLAGDAIPVVQALVNQNAETAAPLLTTLQWPLTLPPAGDPHACFTDHRFAAKMKNPQPVTVTVGAVPSVPASIKPAKEVMPSEPAKTGDSVTVPVADYWHQIAAGTITPEEWLL